MTGYKPKNWQKVLGAALVILILAFLAAGIATTAGNVASQPRPTPQPRIETSVIEAGDGITCVRVHRDKETLHWECLR